MKTDIQHIENEDEIHIHKWRKIAARIFMHSVLFGCFFTSVAVSHENTATGNSQSASILKIKDTTEIPKITRQLKGRPAKYEIHGIDVARYQKRINWDMIGRSGIDFVFIKATEGVLLKDSFFDMNWKQAQLAGIKRGAYHFFLAEKDAKIQAANFLFNTKYEPGDLPPVLDVETTRNMSSKVIRKGMKEWLDVVEKAYGTKPIIYTGYHFYKRHLDGYFDDYPLWIAHYSGSEKDPDCGKWLFWQHSDKGKLTGITGEVDLNVFRSSRTQLDSLCIPGKKPTQHELLTQLLSKNINQ